MFAINGVPKELAGFPESKDAAPQGGETNYVDTWALGPLKSGREQVVPLERDRRARRPLPACATSSPPASTARPRPRTTTAAASRRGVFAGRITDAAPETRVSDDGKTIVEGTR